MANWFTTGTSFCLHDVWHRHATTAKGVKAYLRKLGHEAPSGTTHLGLSDSCSGHYFDELEAEFPAARFALVERDLNDAIEAACKLGIVIPKEDLIERMANLHLEHRYLPEGVHRIGFEELGDRARLAALQQFLVPEIPFNFRRFALLDEMRVIIHEEKYALRLNITPAQVRERERSERARARKEKPPTTPLNRGGQ